jgi:hypothetical protein
VGYYGYNCITTSCNNKNTITSKLLIYELKNKLIQRRDYESGYESDNSPLSR